MNKIVAFVIWLVCLFGILSFCYDLINKPSTVGNIVGFVALVIFSMVSVKTQYFTLIFKSKEEK